MKRKFIALRIISTIYKILAVLAFIAMIGAIAFILINTDTFPTMDSKLQPLGIALGSGVGGTITLLAVAQLLDLLMALELNTRASAELLQRVGKVMKDRL